MNTLQVWLAHLGMDSALRRQADQIAAACADKVSARLNGATPLASRDEARGYVRARAATIIKQRVAATRTANPRFQHQLVEMVAERISERFAPQILSSQAPPVRRAA